MQDPALQPLRHITPKMASSSHELKLVGFNNFKRHNPFADRFKMHKFHSLEFWCGDAQNTAARFSWALGMPMVAKSDLSTQNAQCASYVIKSHDMIFTFTSPYSTTLDRSKNRNPIPDYNGFEAHEFIKRHGGVSGRAIGIQVDDATEAFEVSVANGAIPVVPPRTLVDEATKATVVVSEVRLYGDVSLRYISKHGYTGVYLPGYEDVQSPPISYGIKRIDHIVGNTPKLVDAVNYIAKFTGFHEFAEFISDDVGTVDSGLNSMVLANNNEMILLPINEPTFGTPRKSQIQTYLEHNEGAGIQHIAIKTDDIFATMREMRQRRHVGGFEFMPRPSDKYYKALPEKIGDILTPEQYKEVEELGLLVDKDDQGVLLQVFTRPVSDRPTLFFEIIQRIGCMDKTEEMRVQRLPELAAVDLQVGGCGGFGKGNFSELFKSIEDYERVLDGTAKLNADNTIQKL